LGLIVEVSDLVLALRVWILVTDVLCCLYQFYVRGFGLMVVTVWFGTLWGCLGCLCRYLWRL